MKVEEKQCEKRGEPLSGRGLLMQKCEGEVAWKVVLKDGMCVSHHGGPGIPLCYLSVVTLVVFYFTRPVFHPDMIERLMSH